MYMYYVHYTIMNVQCVGITPFSLMSVMMLYNGLNLSMDLIPIDYIPAVRFNVTDRR
jgi:hypothetical protein